MRGIRHCDEIKVNIEHLSHLIMAASWLSRLDLAVRRRGEPTPPRRGARRIARTVSEAGRV
jgi:hypothetical protein